MFRNDKGNNQVKKSFDEIRAEYDKLDNQDSINLCEERQKRDQLIAGWSCRSAAIIGDSDSKEECRKYTSSLITSIFKCNDIKEAIRKESYTVERAEWPDGRIRTPTLSYGFKNI